MNFIHISVELYLVNIQKYQVSFTVTFLVSHSYYSLWFFVNLGNVELVIESTS